MRQIVFGTERFGSKFLATCFLKVGVSCLGASFLWDELSCIQTSNNSFTPQWNLAPAKQSSLLQLFSLASKFRCIIAIYGNWSIDTFWSSFAATATVVSNLSVMSANVKLNKLRQRMGKTRFMWLEDNTNQIHFQKSISFSLSQHF